MQNTHQTIPQPQYQQTATPTPPTIPSRQPVQKVEVSNKVQQLLIYLFTGISVLLTFRFVLSLLGANTDTPFVNFVYQLTVPLMIPFFNMFGRSPQVAQYRLEFEVLVALMVYAIIFFGIAKLVSILFD